ncbi:hypothetical protein N5J76_03140 [Pseudomonas sp. GD03855]|nr:hypothetical protein [Pseudomonas sp. GD03856]MDH2263915.1 hypothetical protein [Pseudomonas sp. GD03855]
MDDRELLEMASKAAGEDVEWHDSGSYFYRKSCNWPAEKGFFNPLHDDGEALRLAVELRLDIAINLYVVDVFSGGLDDFIRERCRDGDAANATRRAIVRAAAAIGRAM